MLDLFKIEWMKVKSYRSFWVLFGGFILLFPLTFYYSASKFANMANAQQQEMIQEMLGNPFVFPKVWLASGWFGGLFFIMMGMLYILLITNEVQYRTHRQNIIDGWSRFDFLKAKFSMLIFFVLVSTIMVFLCGYWIGSIYTPAGRSVTDGLYYVGYFVLMATMYLLVAFLIAMLVKRTGLSIIIYFAVVCIVDNLLWLALTQKRSQVGYFLPLESTDSLLPNPFKPALIESRTLPDSTLMLVALGYLVLIGYTIKRHFEKIDLKT